MNKKMSKQKINNLIMRILMCASTRASAIRRIIIARETIKKCDEQIEKLEQKLPPEERMSQDKVCDHCKMGIKNIVNPFGDCNHVGYPDSCKVCSTKNTELEK